MDLDVGETGVSGSTEGRLEVGVEAGYTKSVNEGFREENAEVAGVWQPQL